jgi:hypothetical protein
MSTAFARAVVDGMRRHGIRVHEYGGAWSRGNGQSSAYVGALVHHTAGSFDGGMSLLVNGRRDLSGPLCNMAGHANGDVTLVAAHPANHAGASGGRSMGPLPVTRSFNRCVWGLEIMYPGTVPMTAAQYRTAQIMCGVVSGILRRPNPEWARAHAETSITGKYDPGYAPGRTYDMAAFRRGIWGALNSAGPAPVPAPAPAPPPPPPPARFGEDHEMHVYSPEPNPGAAKNNWPRRTVTYGFVPEDVKALHLQWGSRGGWIHQARWWVRDPNWTANIPKHYAKDHPIGAGGSERFIGYGWIAGPPAGADCLELTFSAPDGLHIVPAAK